MCQINHFIVATHIMINYVKSLIYLHIHITLFTDFIIVLILCHSSSNSSRYFLCKDRFILNKLINELILRLHMKNKLFVCLVTTSVGQFSKFSNFYKVKIIRNISNMM